MLFSFILIAINIKINHKNLINKFKKQTNLRYILRTL